MLPKKLADARLVTTSEGEAEVAHEALIREWPALRAWLEEDREALRVQRRLGEAAHEWDTNSQDESSLYRGARLVEAGEWNKTHAGDLNQQEAAFLQAEPGIASKAAERARQQQERLEAAEALAREQQQRADEQAAAATGLRQRAIGLAVALALAVVTALGAVYFFTQANAARKSGPDRTNSAIAAYGSGGFPFSARKPASDRKHVEAAAPAAGSGADCAR